MRSLEASENKWFHALYNFCAAALAVGFAISICIAPHGNRFELCVEIVRKKKLPCDVACQRNRLLWPRSWPPDPADHRNQCASCGEQTVEGHNAQMPFSAISSPNLKTPLAINWIAAQK